MLRVFPNRNKSRATSNVELGPRPGAVGSLNKVGFPFLSWQFLRRVQIWKAEEAISTLPPTLRSSPGTLSTYRLLNDWGYPQI